MPPTTWRRYKFAIDLNHSEFRLLTLTFPRVLFPEPATPDPILRRRHGNRRHRGFSCGSLGGRWFRELGGGEYVHGVTLLRYVVCART